MWDVCRFLITYSALFWSASWPSGASIVTSDHRQRDSPACHPRRETRACNWLAVDHPPSASPLQMAYTAWGNWIASHISCNWPAARARRKINLSSPSGFVLPVRAPDDIRRDAVFWCHVAFYFVSTDSIGPRSSTLVWDPDYLTAKRFEWKQTGSWPVRWSSIEINYRIYRRPPVPTHWWLSGHVLDAI